MKTIICWSIAFLLLLEAYAQNENKVILDGYSAGWLSEGAEYSQTGIRLINIIPTKSAKVNLTTEAFVLDHDFGQALIGTEFIITETWQFSTLVGIVNTPENPLRLGFSSTLRSKKWELLGVYQWGPASSFFYVSKVVRHFDNLAFGLRSQRFLGSGLFVERKMLGSLGLWSQAGYDFEIERYGAALGIKAFF